MAVDQICVTCAEDLREFLIGISVAQAYQLELATGMFNMQYLTRTPRGPYHVTFRLHERFDFFEPCLRVVKENVPVYDYSGWKERSRREYDCFLDLDQDFQRAETVATKLGQHITDGFNILYGCGAKTNPVLKALQLVREKSAVLQVLIVDWDSSVESEIFYSYLQRHYPELEIVLDTRNVADFPVKDIVNYVNYFDIVIGQYGPIPFLAASLGKVVFELFPDQQTKMLYESKKPFYYPVVGNSTANWLWSIWGQSWPTIERSFITNYRQEQTVKEEQQSIAEGVEEPSSSKPIPSSVQ